MSGEYCPDENCPACGMLRHMNHMLKSGCAPEALVPIVLRALTEAVGDVIQIHSMEVTDDEAGTVH